MLRTINDSRKVLAGPAPEVLANESVIVADPKEQMVDHVAVLKLYAARVLYNGEVLLPWEEIDKAARIIEFFALGCSFKCTHRDLVKVMYQGLSQMETR